MNDTAHLIQVADTDVEFSDADLIQFTFEEGHAEIQKTYVSGRPVYVR